MSRLLRLLRRLRWRLGLWLLAPQLTRASTLEDDITHSRVTPWTFKSSSAVGPLKPTDDRYLLWRGSVTGARAMLAVFVGPEAQVDERRIPNAEDASSNLAWATKRP